VQFLAIREMGVILSLKLYMNPCISRE